MGKAVVVNTDPDLRRAVAVELEELEDIEVKFAERLAGKDSVRGTVWGSNVEKMGIKEVGEVCRGEVLEAIVSVFLTCAVKLELLCEEALV